MADRLFSPRFFVMCGFTFTVFLSAFQLLPTAPFRIHELGGSTFASGARPTRPSDAATMSRSGSIPGITSVATSPPSVSRITQRSVT